ncbi:MAG: transposase [Zetaproteobacteria bacterium]|nr:transposase [Zetaproteobacteria bacterium]
MGRPLRIEFDHALYLISSRAFSKQSLFIDDDDREMFLDLLANVVDRFGWICHGYCLFDDEYDLLIETPTANLSRGMRQLNGVYTQDFNRRHLFSGAVFHTRFKSVVIDRSRYFAEISRYLVRLPLSRGLVDRLDDWSWSSYLAMIGVSPPPIFLECPTTLASLGGSSSLRMMQSHYMNWVADGCGFDLREVLQGGHILGDDDFKEWLLDHCGSSYKGDQKKNHNRSMKTLQQLADGAKNRSWMYTAYTKYGYTMQQIADVAGVHYSTVSRAIRLDDECKRAQRLADVWRS